MIRKKLGKSDLLVSELCLGSMSFGWECDEKTSNIILNKYRDFGGNFIDTADIYADGESESIIGRWIEGQNREEIILATKVRYATGHGPENTGLGKKHILSAVEASLRRLKTDYIDLYQVHCWDNKTPLEETLTTLDSIVKAGKVRYIGVSNFTGWQLQKAMDLSCFMELESFISFQGLYNLLDRFLEWDILPVCNNEKLGLICWSPLAGGWLTGKIKPGMKKPPPGSRIEKAENGGWSESWTNYNNNFTWNLLKVFLKLAEEIEKTPAQVALNWLINRPGVTSTIIGVNKTKQLDDNLKTINWSLDENQIQRLNEISNLPPPRYPHLFINRFNTSE